MLSAALLGLCLPLTAAAIARPHHQHEDLFAEDDIQIGFKLGPQVSGFTAYSVGETWVDAKASMRFIGGAAIKFIYEVPRFELDFLWSARAWVNTEDTVNFLAIPILVKIPVEIEKGVDFEIGAGGQPEVAIFGGPPHRRSMFGVVGSLGLSIDFATYVVDFDVRYNVGIDDVSTAYSGAKLRDLQVMAGVLWHF